MVVIVSACPDLKNWGTRQEAYFYFGGNRLVISSVLAENVSHWVSAGFCLTAHYGSVIWPPEDFCVL